MQQPVKQAFNERVEIKLTAEQKRKLLDLMIAKNQTASEVIRQLIMEQWKRAR